MKPWIGEAAHSLLCGSAFSFYETFSFLVEAAAEALEEETVAGEDADLIGGEASGAVVGEVADHFG